MNLERKQIVVKANACLRAALSGPRVKILHNRLKDGRQLPPLVVFRHTEDSYVLIDGWHRLAAHEVYSAGPIPVLAFDDLPTALVFGLRSNMPRDGKLRGGPDCTRSLAILATSLRRLITPAEAESMGLEWCEHQTIDPNMLEAFALPTLPEFMVSTLSKPQGKSMSSANKNGKNRFSGSKA
jgi:hypothetical protein